LRIVENPHEEISLLRVINTPNRGIGASSVEILLKAAVHQGVPLWQVLGDQSLVAQLPSAAQKGIASLQRLVAQFKAAISGRDAKLSEAVRHLVADIDYLGFLDRSFPNPEEAEARKSSVQEVVNAIAEFESTAGPNRRLADFLDDVALSGREFGSKAKDQSNCVALMTYHSAKGLEFPIVYMVGMEEGILPHRRSLAENYDDVEEERRLCYVGITRAQEELTLSLPLTRMKWGKQRHTFVSRFLYEMTGQADNPNRLKAIQAARKECSSRR
jgi:DNA helicase-2/ATP-dependent DNA helicase PcrA